VRTLALANDSATAVGSGLKNHVLPAASMALGTAAEKAEGILRERASMGEEYQDAAVYIAARAARSGVRKTRQALHSADAARKVGKAVKYVRRSLKDRFREE